MSSPHNLLHDSPFGIPEKAIAFITMECQSRWIAQALPRKVSLPSEEDMLSDVERYYKEMKEKGLAEDTTHQGLQADYMEWVFAQTGMAMEQYIKDKIEFVLDPLYSDGGYRWVHGCIFTEIRDMIMNVPQ
ncbi:flavin-containing monooxygenase FMO GS-OX5-like protein [Tanacetum coccineum]